LCDKSFRESSSRKKEKNKNIPLDQFKLDVAVSPLYMQANMLKQNAVTTRCIQDQIEKKQKK
jgi:hypothetical protein